MSNQTNAKEKAAAKAPARMSKKDPLTKSQLELINAWWRASNYLAACQLYLLDNPLLREPLKPEHLKRTIVGLSLIHIYFPDHLLEGHPGGRQLPDLQRRQHLSRGGGAGVEHVDVALRFLLFQQDPGLDRAVVGLSLIHISPTWTSCFAAASSPAPMSRKHSSSFSLPKSAFSSGAKTPRRPLLKRTGV